MIYCDGRTIFLKSIDVSDVIRYYKYTYKQMGEVIKQERVANVV